MLGLHPSWPLIRTWARCTFDHHRCKGLRINELVTLSQFRCSASLLDRSEWVSARPAGYYDQHIFVNDPAIPLGLGYWCSERSDE